MQKRFYGSCALLLVTLVAVGFAARTPTAAIIPLIWLVSTCVWFRIEGSVIKPGDRWLFFHAPVTWSVGMLTIVAVHAVIGKTFSAWPYVEILGLGIALGVCKLKAMWSGALDGIANCPSQGSRM